MIAEDAVHRMFYYLLKEEYKESEKVTESLLIKCLLKGLSREKLFKRGNLGGKIKMKHGNDPLWTSELFENPLVVLLTEHKEIQTTSTKIKYKKGHLGYRLASGYEIENELFVSPDETSDSYKELKKDTVCDAKEKVLKMKDAIHNKIVEKFESNNEKLVKMMEAATKSNEIMQFLEELESNTDENFSSLRESLCGISQSQNDVSRDIKALQSKVDLIITILKGENNALVDDKRKISITDSNRGSPS